MVTKGRHKRCKKGHLVMLIALMIVCMISGSIIYASSGENLSAASIRAQNAEIVVDDPSINDWTEIAQSNTKFIGRIWTDKTVYKDNVTLPGTPDITVNKGDSDFLVALSAISSTSNIRTLSGGVPLDIVMVLDTSGSMDEDMGAEYVQTYDDGKMWQKRYVLVDGKYTEIKRYGLINWTWQLNGKDIQVKYSESDSGYQMYKLEELSKMDALKNAVNNFIDATADINGSISSSDERHRISIVNYASSSDIRQHFVECTNDTKADLKSVVNELNANGATAADYGMEKAAEELKTARAGAKKVVIFFTDGEPNHQSGFDGNVADAAIGIAKTMKDSGTIIYSIGIFENADPAGDSNANKYMNGISSNYPDAESYKNLGNRVSEDANYYKVAADSAKLNNIFNEILEESVSNAGYPTHIDRPSGEPVDAAKSGYVTFTDKLGSYMQVDSFKSIIFADEEFTLPANGKTTSGETDTYVFEGTAGNTLYPNGNLNSIIITVKHGQNLKDGDTVTVAVPAAMIPLRDFDVDSENTDSITTTVSETLPIRIFYGVSLKEGVAKALENPDSDLAQYISENSKDGKVSFYSNDFTSGSELGNTTSKFIPAIGNSFYYFTEDSYLFSDEECTVPITENIQGHGGYYYQRTYYEKDSGTPKTYAIDIRGSGLNQLLESARKDDNKGGQYYIPAGTPRLTTVNDTYREKVNNLTGTAKVVISPIWNELTVAGAKDITVYLGNNGRMDLDLPGTLKISKNVETADGFDAQKFNNTEFEFELDLGQEAGTYDTQIVSKDGTKTSGTIQNGDSFKLKSGEQIYVYGLEAGVKYSVTEKSKVGFTATVTGNNGTVISGQEQEIKFTNTYKAEIPASVDTSRFFKGYKVLSGRDWKAGESFRFVLDNGTAPAAEKSEVTLTSKEDGTYKENSKIEFDFGKVTFTRPGVYKYDIFEVEPVQTVPGMSYSSARYQVTVTVEDNGDGTMSASSEMKQVRNDEAEQTDKTVDIAAFTNKYGAEAVMYGPIGYKEYKDLSGGGMPLENCNFRFRVTPLTEGAPVPGSVDESAESFTVGQGEHQINYGNAKFTAQHDKPYYDYLLEEVIPQGADESNNYVLNGMKYDPAKYIARFSPEVVQEPGQEAQVRVTVSYWHTIDGVTPLRPIDDKAIHFYNSYDPEDAVLTGDTAFHGEKTLIGRDMKDGEVFSFNLQTADRATAQAVADGKILISSWDNTLEKASASVSEAKDGVSAGFDFGNATFTEVGTYKFTITEEPGSAGGVSYDNHETKVTVTVTDENGSLKASVDYDNGKDRPDDKAVFENRYKASLDYGQSGGIIVTKTLNGRNMNVGEFTFTIESDDKKLSQGDAEFTNPAGRDGDAVVMKKLQSLKFTEADVGKTFTYILDETEDKDAGGITYDKSKYKIEITVTDPEKDGRLSAETSVTKIMDSQGKEVNEAAGKYDLAENEVPEVAFVNSYNAEPLDFDTEGLFTKILRGRKWLDSDEFKFNIRAVTENAPMPDNTEVKVNKPEKGDSVKFGFGKITFNRAGVYEYRISEEAGNIPGVKYSSNEAVLKVTVRDNGDGTFTAVPDIISGTFENIYKASIDYEAAGGLEITKTLTGRNMEEGQFEFTVKGLDDESRQKLKTDKTGLKFENEKAADGEKITVVSLGEYFSFGMSDAGKTYTYEIAETNTGAHGYIYDREVRTVKISISDNLDGRMKVVTKITGGNDTAEYTYITGEAASEKAVVNFENRYKSETTAETAASLKAEKKLIGRPLNDGEFKFEVATKGNTTETVMTGTNNAEGVVNFNKKFEYTTDTLKKAVKDGYAVRSETEKGYQWTVNYIVSEDTTGFAQKGITAANSSYDFTVIVQDNGDGTLTSKVNYPEGESVIFTNVYSTGEPIALNLSGSKILKAEEGLLPDDITGKFTFTLEGKDNAPMPSCNEVQNDKNGNISFGNVTFSLDMLKDVKTADDGSRTKVFKYVVSESGTMPGITNDTEKDFTVILKDDGKGHLTANAGKGAMFTFVNSYMIEKPVYSSITDDIEITKTLDGADLSEYEFEFELLENDKVVSTAKNDASGNVVFSGIKYTEPGTHYYAAREVNGGIRGITYDKDIYKITTEVKDNGDGTLSVEHSLSGDGELITFENKYEITQGASVEIGASKILDGAELAEGQFTFELLDENGKVIDTAVNDENGVILFGEIKYKEPGTYKYKVREVNDGQKGILYDEKVYGIVVNVRDVDSVLEVDIEADEMIFTNVLQKSEPPAEDDTPKTGDSSGIIGYIMLAAAGFAGSIFVFRRRKA